MMKHQTVSSIQSPIVSQGAKAAYSRANSLRHEDDKAITTGSTS